jgi:hypothetical protein
MLRRRLLILIAVVTGPAEAQSQKGLEWKLNLCAPAPLRETLFSSVLHNGLNLAC